MTRTERLEYLFAEWERSKPEYLENFSRDGIVDGGKYDEARPRLLFIQKEPNAHHDDLRGHANHFVEGTDWSNPTWRNLALWSYGLLRGFPPFTQLPDYSTALAAPLREVAVMNLKKTPGGALAVNQNLEAFAQDPSNQQFIRRELETIEPDAIICCGPPTFDLIREIILPLAEMSTTPNGLRYFRWQTRVVVGFSHPARSIEHAMLYAYLMGELRTLLHPS